MARDMRKHTAGPWASGTLGGDLKIIRSETRLVCKVYATPDRAMESANIALISAAPDMLEALTQAADALGHILAGNTGASILDFLTVENMARDAISKATGTRRAALAASVQPDEGGER